MCIISMCSFLELYLSDIKIFKQWLNLAYVPYSIQSKNLNKYKKYKISNFILIWD